MAPTAPHDHVGSPAAVSALCDEINAEPGAGFLLDIIGPGGWEDAANRGGSAVLHQGRHAGNPRSSANGDLTGAPVLIDDAHLRDDASLGRLWQLASHPASDCLSRTVNRRRARADGVGGVLTAHRPPIVLGHLDRSATGARVSELMGIPCPQPLARLLHEQTAGLPVLLEQLMVGLRDTGQLTREVLRHLAPRTRLDVPAGVREQLRY